MGLLHSKSSTLLTHFWIVLASLILVVGGSTSCDFLGWWNALIIVSMGSDGATPYGSPIPTHLCRSIPVALGVCSMFTLGIRNPKVRGGGVTLTAVLALTLGYANVYFVGNSARALGLWIEMVLAAAMVAAGNRTMLLAPGKMLPRVLSGLGGAKLILGFLVPADDLLHASILSRLVGNSLEGRDPEVDLFAALLLFYAIVGTVNPFARRPPKIRCRAMSLIGYLLLGAFPYVLYRDWSGMNGGGPEPYRTYRLAFMLKFWLLSTGFTILLAAGMSSWVAESLAQRKSGSDNSTRPMPERGLLPE